MAKKNVGKGDASTEGLPKRLNKAERQKDQAEAARVEDHGGFSAGGRPGRDRPEGWDYDRGREH